MRFTKETLRRALRTAVQAAVAYLSTQLMAGVDLGEWRAWLPSVIAGIIGAVLGAVMNLEATDEEADG